jgi:dynamin 1-like protein
MAIVNDRMNANKPAPSNPALGKLAPGQINNNKDLDVDLKKDESSFFGSFFSSAKSTQVKKKATGATVMESVSESSLYCAHGCFDGVVASPGH